MTKENDKGEVTVTGNIGKKIKYEHFPETQKSLLTAALFDEDSKTHLIIAFNRNAERFKEAIDAGITKFTVIGKAQQSEDKSKTEIVVNELAKHSVMQISGKITKVDQKEVGNKKIPITELLIISEQIPEPGKVTTQSYNVTIWPNTKSSMPPEVILEPGKPIAIKGEGKIFDYQNGSKGIKIESPWNVDVSVKKLETQIATRQEAAAARKDQEVQK